MAFTPKLTYKGRPLVRCKNDIYYGSLSDPYVIFMQVLTSKEENGVQVADRIHVTLLSTDTTKSPIERMKKQSDKNGLWSALEIGTIWLEKSLLDAKKEEKNNRRSRAGKTPPGFLCTKKAPAQKRRGFGCCYCSVLLSSGWPVRSPGRTGAASWC